MPSPKEQRTKLRELRVYAPPGLADRFAAAAQADARSLSNWFVAAGLDRLARHERKRR